MARFSENAMTVLKARYLRNDMDAGIMETPEAMLRRVANALSPADEDRADAFYSLMDSLDFLPNTPTLINSGRENGQLSACFVLPIEDSMEGIFDAVKNAALIHKTGGGTGFSFSRLRAKGERVASTGGEASGVVSFLRVFNEATNSVKQGGVRRGANMGLLRVDHPDIEEFIACKDDPTQLTNFNISVGITDTFMEAVKCDGDWPLVDPHTSALAGTVKARNLWYKIVCQAWKNGEPGIVFLDRLNACNPTPELGAFEATNPCGEQPLLPYESCNLGSINLANHVARIGVGKMGLDIERLRRTAATAVDFLNAVLDHNHFPLPVIRERTLRTRKIGLGVMGFADMLIKLGVPYDSEAAVELAEYTMTTIRQAAYCRSQDKGYQNATITTIAPTGSISLIAGVSSGIEPNFAWVYNRNACEKTLRVVHPLMEQRLREIGRYDDQTLSLLAQGTPIEDIRGLHEALGDYWRLSRDIAPEAHIRIQAAFQKYTDNAVSKTINLPNSATETDVANAYSLAYETGCKGVTVYRDGSRDSQVLNTEQIASKEPEKSLSPIARVRPQKVEGRTEVKKIGCGKLYVTVNNDAHGPIEVFTNTGKAGGCPAQSEGLARMISLALRHNIPVEAITKQLCGIRCMSTVCKDGCVVLSCPDAIGRTLKGACTEPTTQEQPETNTPLCPECLTPIERAEGCVICRNCGYSKCG